MGAPGPYPQVGQAPLPQQTPWGQQVTWGQPYPWPAATTAPAYPAYPVPPVPAPPQPAAVPQVSLDDRATQALGHLAAHESCGPTDLVRAYGSSAATWSRTLSALAAQGLVMKDGQKYRLTGIGRSFV